MLVVAAAGSSEATTMKAKSAIITAAFDPPPLKWSDLRYVFDVKEDRNGKEAIQA
jgi:hypothetical protein